MQKNKVNIQGHRGARGLYPENTLTGFIEAAKLGVDTLEMDVVISKDFKVVVSHEPWMHELFCTKPNGNRIEKDSQEKYNLFKMPYSEIKTFNCGEIGNTEFPSQKKLSEYKPLLSDVIRSVQHNIKTNNLQDVAFNIEIKSELDEDNIFQPEPKTFTQLVYNEVKNIKNKLIIQSFDVRVLQELRKLDKEIKIGLLAENENSSEENINRLGFIPFTYNPYFRLVNETLVSKLHSQNIQISPWTINETLDMKNLISMGVDGIITDYPDLKF